MNILGMENNDQINELFIYNLFLGREGMYVLEESVFVVDV